MDQMQQMKLAANTIRTLSADAIQKANSGHPGLPLGVADFAFVLFYKYLRHNPANPAWFGRDRFVLSAGHGSMLLYSMLHLFGYGLTIDDLKEFRQWNSRTPGHPEYHLTPGVEVTTGPLGSGFASAVGMAAAFRHFAAAAGIEKSGCFDPKIYVVAGDGCLMEGGTYEASSLAGHLKLDNIICFYDSNEITIEGSTGLACTCDVRKRFDAAGWRVLEIADANDLAQCDRVLAAAQRSDGRPTIIIGHTVIGWGAPNKQGTAACHGAALGEDEVALLKKNLGVGPEKFFVPDEVRKLCAERREQLAGDAAAWDCKFRALLDADPELAARMESFMNPVLPADLEAQLAAAVPTGKTATRVAGSAVLQRAAELVPSLIGGAADVGNSTGTLLKKESDFTAADRAGRNLHFGVRELAMGWLANGLALSGLAIPYCSTFFVFSDYMKPALRLAALMKLHVIYVFTHDSFYVGEDGATHQPIEQISMLRNIPGMTVIRPADAAETAQAWALALRRSAPAALLLTRQGLEPLPEGVVKPGMVARGAYVVSDDPGFEYILMASGSEVGLALKTAALLRAGGKKVRVVSVPSQELFAAQDADYRASVLPGGDFKRVSLEAACTCDWQKYLGFDGLAIGLDHFGSSAPAEVLAREFGFTPEAVLERIERHFI
ncbi:MAG: transketolase [Victivallaceae bacterium]|nr:transketolase [Victivallaceae bacterium]